MKKSLLHLFLFGISGGGFFFLLLAVYISDKTLAGRLAIDLALINLGGSICRFGLDAAIIQRSDKKLRFGLGDALFVVPLAAMLYSLAMLAGAQNVGFISLTGLVTMVAFNEILAAHLRNSGWQISIYLVRIISFVPGITIILLVENLNGGIVESALLLVNAGVSIGLFTTGCMRTLHEPCTERERITMRWLGERFTLFANLNSQISTLLAKVDVLVFAALLPVTAVAEYSIIKQILGILMFISTSFNYRYASKIRRVWQDGSREIFRTKFKEHTREARFLTAIGLLLVAAVLALTCEVIDITPNMPLFASLMIAYGVVAITSPAGMYLTAMGHIGFQTIRILGSLILFLILASTLNLVSQGSTLVLATYSVSIAAFQILLFASLTHMLQDR